MPAQRKRRALAFVGFGPVSSMLFRLRMVNEGKTGMVNGPLFHSPSRFSAFWHARNAETAGKREMAGPSSRKVESPESAVSLVQSALRTLKTETEGLEALSAALKSGLGDAFITAVGEIRAAKGRVIVTGMGKSGHVGRKIAATLASTGTPAYFVHPGEASHGDLGVISRDDAIIALSWSGETM